MIVRELSVSNYRNIESLVMEPSENVNVIFGENAQGKTNLLESIWLFTGCRSFRTKRDGELVRFGRDFAENGLRFFAKGREQKAVLRIDDRRTASKNGVTLKSPAELIGEFCAVVFFPAQLALVKEGPLGRRKFLDTAIAQLKPRYAGKLARYSHTLGQRNALLKDIQFHSELYDTLDVWDERLAAFGAEVTAERIGYIRLLSPLAAEIYGVLSGGKEKLSLKYESGLGLCNGDPSELRDALTQALLRTRREDLYNRQTCIGPHRDDLGIRIDELSARNFGSQGQQRSAALSVKLGEAEILRQISGEEPVILLDDVMSELDEKRQDYVLNHIVGRQVFITCCEPNAVLRLRAGKAFHIEGGALKGAVT